MTKWYFRDGVSQEDIKKAQSALLDAINDIDTPEEWSRLAKNAVLTIGKIAIGYLPVSDVAIDVLGGIFEGNEKIESIIERILEEKTNE
jgi:hypothetical protein